MSWSYNWYNGAVDLSAFTAMYAGGDVYTQFREYSDSDLSTLALRGDVNGDGFDDWVSIQNISYVLHGTVIFGDGSLTAPTIDPATLDGSNGFRIFHSTQSAWALSAAVLDVNVDGYADIVVTMDGEPAFAVEQVILGHCASTTEGGADADQLIGANGNDTLIGYDGDDRLNGGLGADTLDGGAGDDTYRVDNTGDIVIESQAEGVDTVYSTLADYTLPDNVENLILAHSGVDGAGNAEANYMVGRSNDNVLQGLDGNDTILGQGGVDRLEGGAGDDTLRGGGGDDTVLGGGNVDTLYGQSGKDKLDGGDGNDRIYGGRGFDTMTGGAGADTFYFSDDDRIGGTTVMRDTITDFSQADLDKIDFSDLDANLLVDGQQSFVFIDTNPFVQGVAGVLRYQYIAGSDTTQVQADLDGDSVADIIINFTGNIELTGADFGLWESAIFVSQEPLVPGKMFALEHLGAGEFFA